MCGFVKKKINLLIVLKEWLYIVIDFLNVVHDQDAWKDMVQDYRIGHEQRDNRCLRDPTHDGTIMKSTYGCKGHKSRDLREEKL